MKFIHCGDLHWGKVAKFTGNEGKVKRQELRDTFSRLADYAVKNNVTAVLVAGDIFDTGKPSNDDLKGFLEIVKQHSETRFLCLRGNHDGGVMFEGELPENIDFFGAEWGKYDFGNVSVYGLELCDENREAAPLALSPDRNRYNIVMLHGQVGGDIVINKYADKGIDYMALGHVHSYGEGKIDERGKWTYCGCLEPRGFDETGEKGFVLIDTDACSREFVRFSKRTVYNVTCDLSDCGQDGTQEALGRVCPVLDGYSREDGIRLVLTGSVRFDPEDLTAVLVSRYGKYFHMFEVKNETGPYVDVEALINDKGLEGVFVRSIMNNGSYDDEAKIGIIDVCLRALREGKL